MALFTEVKALAFDLDGTLIDSVPGLASAVDTALAAFHLPPAGIQRVATWIGNGADILITRALTWALNKAPEPEMVAEARQLMDARYAISVRTGSILFPQVKETLAILAQKGLPMAIVTNKPTPFIEPLLSALDIADHFTLVLGGDDVVAKKPHPAPLFFVLGTWGLLPQELLFIGDSRNDILAAQAAGCPSVGFTYGYNYGEPIADSHPSLVLDHFNDLLPALGL
ncbi:MAG: Phosphoglycolate phosphatase [Candidatus Erwinia impunctatus]|nr:Phosphoglycolate phosphatase [Culicoides impunctatus]